MLSRKRFNDFAGNDQEYLDYLCKVVFEASLASTASLEKCILLLENGLQSLYQPQSLRNLPILPRDQLSRNPGTNEESSPVQSQPGKLAVNRWNSETGCQKPCQNLSAAQPSKLIINTWNPEIEYHESSQDPADTQTSKRARWLSQTRTFF